MILDPNPKIYTVIGLEFYVTIHDIVFKFDWSNNSASAGKEPANFLTPSESVDVHSINLFSMAKFPNILVALTPE